jgi:hypothetical protein
MMEQPQFARKEKLQWIPVGEIRRFRPLQRGTADACATAERLAFGGFIFGGFI